MFFVPHRCLSLFPPPSRLLLSAFCPFPSPPAPPPHCSLTFEAWCSERPEDHGLHLSLHLLHHSACACKTGKLERRPYVFLLRCRSNKWHKSTFHFYFFSFSFKCEFPHTLHLAPFVVPSIFNGSRTRVCVCIRSIKRLDKRYNAETENGREPLTSVCLSLPGDVAALVRKEAVSARLATRAEAAKLRRSPQEKRHETNLCGVSSAALVRVSLAAQSSVRGNQARARAQMNRHRSLRAAH